MEPSNASSKCGEHLPMASLIIQKVHSWPSIGIFEYSLPQSFLQTAYEASHTVANPIGGLSGTPRPGHTAAFIQESAL